MDGIAKYVCVIYVKMPWM